MQKEPLLEIVPQAKELIVYSEGRSFRFQRESEGFASVVAAWRQMTENAVRMPAFGVSIDRLTREEMKRGLWVEFLYARQEVVAEMPFTALLFAVKEDFFGFNVERLYEGGYNGRCFYIDLRGTSMQALASVLTELTAKFG